MDKSETLPALTLFRNFQHQKMIKRVRIRVLRTWRPWDYYNTKKDGLHYLLMDSEGDMIHTFVTEDYYPMLTCIMEVNHIYDIVAFHTNKDNVSNVKIVNHEYELLFTTYTRYLNVPEEEVHEFPHQTYNHLDFLEFKATRYHKVYPDVYGCVKSVFMGETFMKQKNRVEPKCDVILQNIRREELRITFWNKNAESFNMTPFLEADKPIFTIFTTLTSTHFGDEPVASATNHTCVIVNPPVKEEHLYTLEFSKPGDKVKVTQNQNIPEHETNKKISELYILDQSKFKNKTLHCRAWIKEISQSQSWYKIVCSYKGCYKDLYDEDSDNRYRCILHGLQPINPCYRIRILMNDEEAEIVGVIQGENAERILGVNCKELLEEIGLADKYQLPHIVKEWVGHQYQFSFTIQFGHLPTPYIKHMERIKESNPTNPTPEKKESGKRVVGRALFSSTSEKKPRSSTNVEKVSNEPTALQKNKDKEV